MLNTLQKWLDGLELTSEKTSLRTLLPTINVVLVLLVIIGISLSAVGLLRKLANEQGLSQVQLAGTSAREELRKLSEDTLKQTRNLARDATLLRLLQDDSADMISPLKRACGAAGMDACVLVRNEQVLVRADVQNQVQYSDQDWLSILTAAREQGERFSVVPSGALPALMGASGMV